MYLKRASVEISPILLTGTTRIFKKNSDNSSLLFKKIFFKNMNLCGPMERMLQLDSNSYLATHTPVH